MTAYEDVLDRLLPDRAVLRVWSGDWVPALLPEEQAVVERSVPMRRAEFARGRWCAHKALDALGGPSDAILPGAGREPRWPNGFVGSITHTADFVAAVVAPDPYRGLGIDVELNRQLPAGVREHVLTASEQQRGMSHELELVTFCAKEAVYKAVYPLTQSWLDFPDVEIHLAPRGGEFRVAGAEGAERSVDGLEDLRGRFLVGEQHVFAIVHW